MIGRNKENSSIINALKDNNNQTITDYKEIASIFSKHYKTILTNSNPHLDPTFLMSDQNNNLNVMSSIFINNQIDNSLQNLGSKRGLDFVGISAFILNYTKNQFVQNLKNYFIDIFRTSCFPDEINISKIIPVYKNKGKKSKTIVQFLSLTPCPLS